MIKVESITKEFKNNKKYPGFRGAIKSFFSTEYVIKKAVEDISFEIEKGEIVGYIGANGAGKSTTIKMMTGILTPTSGKITVDGLVPYENRKEMPRILELYLVKKLSFGGTCLYQKLFHF